MPSVASTLSKLYLLAVIAVICFLGIRLIAVQMTLSRVTVVSPQTDMTIVSARLRAAGVI